MEQNRQRQWRGERCYRSSSEKEFSLVLPRIGELLVLFCCGGRWAKCSKPFVLKSLYCNGSLPCVSRSCFCTCICPCT